jgi:anti-sigma B factor antagonist
MPGADPDQELRIDVSALDEGLFHVALCGDMDIVSSPQFTERIAMLRASHVVVSLAGVGFIDSCGLNALVAAARVVEADGGTIVFASPNERTRRVFDVVRLADVVALEETVDAAVLRARSGDRPGE